ncbi:hypothetical protein ACN24M_00885 [Streptomyces microflavus]|uniref:hypothetical protein n=1 Tax=Streptomyces microflavus TaxID=1919 RepID=UPI003B2205B4
MTPQQEQSSYHWGTVAPTANGVQSNACVVGAVKVGRITKAQAHETATPTTPKAPRQQETLPAIGPLVLGGVNLGKVSGVRSCALTHKVARSGADSQSVPTPGAAYANVGAGSVDVDVPDVEGASSEGAQLSGVGVHVSDVDVQAQALPGKPVEFQCNIVSGQVSIAGAPVLSFPLVVPANFSTTLPKDGDSPVLVVLNEQITTDEKGIPTRGSNGAYQDDPSATSGYVNAVRICVPGTDISEIVIGHAAVIRDPATTDAR